MVNGQSSTLIFVDDSKGRARHRGVAFQTGDESLREQSLAAAEFAFESKDRTGNKIFRKASRDRFRFSGAVGNERSQGVIYDLRLLICA